ncbi:MAG: TRAP transporter TatT component family protein [bacterium]|nr:TRAP transporter TatT component family protein [bacterium]
MEEVQQLIDDRELDYPGNLQKAKDILEKAVESDAAGALPKLAEVLFWLGDYASEDSDKEKYFAEGVEVGKQAVEAAPDAVSAHMWYASNMGNHGMVRGMMSSLFYLGPIEKHGKRAIELDENYFDAGPLRLMGRFYHQAPGWPVGSGDHKKSMECLEKAVKIAPNFGFNKTYLADLLIAKGKKDQAKTLLDEVIAIPEDPKLKILQERCREDARELLKKV